MMSDPLSNILSQGETCPTCQERNDFRAQTCASCGAPLAGEEEEERLSVLSTASAAPSGDTSGLTPEQAALVEKIRTKIPLERSQNLVMLKAAGQGAQDGTITPEEYRTSVRKLRNIGDSGVKILANQVVQKKVAALSEETQRVRDAMHEGFQQVLDGAIRMEKWLTSGDVADAIEGGRLAEAGYRCIDRAQDAALLLG